MRRRACAAVLALLSVMLLPSDGALADRAPAFLREPAKPIPLVVDSHQLREGCGYPNSAPGTECHLWYDQGGFPAGDLDFALIDLYQWGVAPGDDCLSSGGAADRADLLLYDYPVALPLDEPGPTYVCSQSGHVTANYQDLVDRVSGGYVGWPGPRVVMPVNDCEAQIDANGDPVACGAGLPDRWAIVGFVRLELTGVYQGDDPLAVGGVDGPGFCGLRPPDPNSLCLTARTFDQPDLTISAERRTGYAGSDSYNTDGTGQVAEREVIPGGFTRFFVEIQNDGTGRDSVSMMGLATDPELTVRYFRGADGITARILAGTYELILAPGESVRIRLEVRLAPDARRGETYRTLLRGLSDGDPDAVDAVKARVVAK